MRYPAPPAPGIGVRRSPKDLDRPVVGPEFHLNFGFSANLVPKDTRLKTTWSVNDGIPTGTV